VVVAPSGVVIVAIIAVLFAPAAERALPGIGVAAYAIGAAFAVLLYASILVHELGHVAVARSYGIPVRQVTLQLLGGASELERPADSPRQELLIAAAGPALSLLLGLGGVLALATTDPTGVVRLLLVQITAANLLVGAFNLLPGLPLDGGRIVRSLVWAATARPDLGTRVAGWVGRGVAVITILVPFALAAAVGRDTPDWFAVIWAAMISAFIWAGAGQALRVSRHEAAMPTLSARALARRAIPTSADTPLALALQRMTDAAAAAVVVVDADDRPIAILNEAAVAAVPAARRPWVSVGGLSRRIDQTTTVPVDLVGQDLVARFVSTSAPELLVTDRSGLVVGVISAADVAAALGGPPAPGATRDLP
jgi:Zn-dependent protease